ncbi:MAG: Asp-tRNA(Asn)/Glu-tRNA(Gln) amidotransferase subunit GatC [Bacillales bacterium]
MKEVNKEVLKEAANNLLFDMEDNEYETLLEEFKIISQQFDLIKNIENVDNVEPMTFPFDVTIDYLREDEVKNLITKDDALKNASNVLNGQIKLPKVI